VLAQHPQARLMIIGEGGERPKLEAFAANLGISHAVIWTGFRQDMPRLLAAMDVYVQSSVNEGLCLSILEAMAAGKPVIATDVGGTQEVLTHQKTGILIPPVRLRPSGRRSVDLLGHPEKRVALSRRPEIMLPRSSVRKGWWMGTGASTRAWPFSFYRRSSPGKMVSEAGMTLMARPQI